ncbi:hypothetical protein AVEN_113738-1 [Araneus ventricosus]|uniref:Uncharacterized protein n=1 Tax=Araneus ventricosus TaxID=182803 RepID=A0A4Y2QXG2_ARAVE|nr:hypothetical protein AVEN_113738-1 [Araneus ventricosus]
MDGFAVKKNQFLSNQVNDLAGTINQHSVVKTFCQAPMLDWFYAPPGCWGDIAFFSTLTAGRSDVSQPQHQSPELDPDQNEGEAEYISMRKLWTSLLLFFFYLFRKMQ